MEVLFIGNSLIGYHDSSGLLQQMSAREGAPVYEESITTSYATLGFHWMLGDAARRIRGVDWSCVVLQEFSTLSASDPSATLKHFRDSADLERTSAGARIFIFENCTRRSRSRDATRMAVTYAEIQRAAGGIIAPVSTAWRHCAEEVPDVRLMMDGRHPPIEGICLAACILFG